MFNKESQNQPLPPLLVPPVIRAVKEQRAPTLYLIILFKLGKGLLLLLAGFAAFKLVGTDLQRAFANLLQNANLEPDGRYFGEVSHWLETVTAMDVRLLAMGTVFYSLFSLAEGVGLLLRATWGGWMAIGESAFFIPVEIYEMLHRFSVMVAIVLILNAAIVWYLYVNRRRLFRH